MQLPWLEDINFLVCSPLDRSPNDGVHGSRTVHGRVSTCVPVPPGDSAPKPLSWRSREERKKVVAANKTTVRSVAMDRRLMMHLVRFVLSSLPIRFVSYCPFAAIRYVHIGLTLFVLPISLKLSRCFSHARAPYVLAILEPSRTECALEQDESPF